jgi:hypothetical protein
MRQRALAGPLAQSPLKMHTVNQHSKAVPANKAMIPTEIVASGPSCASRRRLKDKRNSLMTPDLYLRLSRNRRAFGSMRSCYVVTSLAAYFI